MTRVPNSKGSLPGLIARILVALLLLFSTTPLHAAAASPTLPPVAWTPRVFEVSVLPGTAAPSEITFTSSRALQGVSFFVVPEIAPFFSLGSTVLPEVQSGLTYHLGAFVHVPAGTLPGTYEGTVHLRIQNTTIPSTLKVLIHVGTPSSTSVPPEVALPSADRIVTDADDQVLTRDELVVMLDFDVADPAQRIAEIASTTGAVIIGAVPATLTYQLQYAVQDLASLDSILANLEALPGVHAVSHHYFANTGAARIPNDTRYDENGDGSVSDDWTESSPAGNNWNLEFIRAASAWDTTTGDASVTVAVVDYELDDRHSDLNDNVAFTTGPDVTCSSTANPPCSDLSNGGHGTHVSGIICAEGNNGQGVSGLVWNCSLRFYDLNVSWLQGLLGLQSSVKAQERMVQAINDSARVVNMSLQWIDNNDCGTAGTSTTLQKVKENNAVLGQAILYAERQQRDVLWVFAAGNECRDVKYASPASLTFDFPLNTIAVAAIERSGDLSYFSNFGDLVTVAAPGGDNTTAGGILSTLPRGCSCPIPFVPLFCSCSDQYGVMSGTSMAAPHVTGLAALVMSAHPTFSAAKVKDCILSGAESNGASVSGRSFKVIDAPAAVTCRGVVVLPQQVDMVFSVDLTGSMGGEIARVKAEIGDVITQLRTRVSPSTDFRFGVVSYEDYAGFFDSGACGSAYAEWYGTWGSKPGGDAPFRIDQPLTADASAVQAAISGVVIGSGDDGPQSYARVFWEVAQTDTGAQLGWRPSALKLLVNFGDNVPHDVDLNQGVNSPPFGTFDTGVDPGRNAVVDCGGDDIDLQDGALAEMRTRGIHLLHVDSSGSGDLAPYWQYWVSLTGGAYAAINPDGSIPGGLDLTGLIISLLGLIP